uniref:B box-type domain-containing protein n=1 Tax=Leersia perrieri TaxID=77586 RepID=A0A0D9WU34_9ORYZ
MRVQCDVCGVSPAAVLCCADEAALCSACDRRVHRANRLAGKHRRLPLIHPSDSGAGESGGAAPPMCDVCREKRGLVFCVEDRAILCPDCDDPIHAANHLTAKHTRFLLVGAKLSAADVADDDDDGEDGEHAIPSSDCSSDDAIAAAAATKEDQSSSVSAAVDAGGGGGGGSSISDYLTTICPGWQVEDLLLPDDGDVFVSNAGVGVGAGVGLGKEKDGERVPFIDADLFDAVGAGRTEKKGGGAWAPHVPQLPAWCLDDVAAAMATPPPVKPAKQGHVRERQYWKDVDAFAVPEFSPPAKRARPSQQYWCF